MGTITRGLSNNITTGGVILPAGITNASVSAVTSFANAPAGTLTLLSTQTASASATISFTTGLNSTYDEYIFKFINIHPSNDNVYLAFQASTNGGSSYNVTVTTSVFRAYHQESDASTALEYYALEDEAQVTTFVPIIELTGNENDNGGAGTLTFFNPSSTTYVKHFISSSNTNYNDDYQINWYKAGYFNTTSAINAIQFKMSAGNIDDGIIKLYGVKKS